MISITSASITTPSSAGWLKSGDTLTIQLDLDSSLDYTGGASVTINTSPDLTLPCITAQGSTESLQFSTTIPAGVSSYGLVSLVSAEIPSVDIDTLPTESLSPEVTIDSIPPTFNTVITADKPGAKTGDTFTFTIFSNELLSAEPTVTIWGNNATYISGDDYSFIYQYTVTESTPECAAADVSITADDLAGNNTQQIATLHIIIDNTLPTAPGTPINDDSDLTIGLIAVESSACYDDHLAYYEFALTGPENTSVTSYSTSAIFYVGTDGDYTVKARGVDIAGNIGPWSASSQVFTVNTARPTVVISTDSIYTNSNVLVSAVFSDEVELYPANINIAGGTLLSYQKISTYEWMLNIAPFADVLYVEFLEGAGVGLNGQRSLESNKLTIYCSGSRPSVKITPEKEYTNISSVKFYIEFSADMLTIQTGYITVVNGSLGNITGSGKYYEAVVSALDNGVVSLKLEDLAAIDIYGNLSTASNTAISHYSNVQPSVTSITVDKPNNYTYEAGETISFILSISEDVCVFTEKVYPRLMFKIGDRDREAIYKTGSGTNRLVFTYTVRWDDPSGPISTGDIAVDENILNIYGTELWYKFEGQMDKTVSVDPSVYKELIRTEIEARAARTYFEKTLPDLISRSKLKSGVGGLDDLLVSINYAGGKWMADIKPGYFYFNDVEYYLYADKITKTVDYITGPIDLSLTKEGYDNSRIPSYGPILVSADEYPYTQIDTSLRECKRYQNGTIYKGTIRYNETQGIVCGCYRDSFNSPMRQVPGKDYINDSNEYAVEEIYDNGVIRRLYYSGEAPIYVREIDTGGSLVIEDMIIVRDGKAALSYPSPKDTVICLLKDGVYTEYVPDSIEDNIVTLPPSIDISGIPMTIRNGDTVIAKYKAERTWELTGSSITTSTAGSLVITYEGSPDGIIHTYNFDSSDVSFIPISPNVSQSYPGYFYLEEDGANSIDPVSITAAVSPQKGYASFYSKQPVDVAVYVSDKNLKPVSGCRIVFESSGIAEFVKASGTSDAVPGLCGMEGINITVDKINIGGRDYYPNNGFTYTYDGSDINIIWTTQISAGIKGYIYYTPGPGAFDHSLAFPHSLITGAGGSVRTKWIPYWEDTAVIKAKILGTNINGSAKLIQKSKDDEVAEQAANNQKPGALFIEAEKINNTYVITAYLTELNGGGPIPDTDVSFFSSCGSLKASVVKTNGNGIAQTICYFTQPGYVYASVKYERERFSMRHPDYAWYETAEIKSQRLNLR